jgi:hypothetical protein
MGSAANVGFALGVFVVLWMGEFGDLGEPLFTAASFGLGTAFSTYLSHELGIVADIILLWACGFLSHTKAIVQAIREKVKRVRNSICYALNGLLIIAFICLTRICFSTISCKRHL